MSCGLQKEAISGASRIQHKIQSDAPKFAQKKSPTGQEGRQRLNHGAPGGTRTHNLRIRSPLLCPVELRAPQKIWSGKRDSNPRPTAWKAVALAS